MTTAGYFFLNRWLSAERQYVPPVHRAICTSLHSIFYLITGFSFNETFIIISLATSMFSVPGKIEIH